MTEDEDNKARTEPGDAHNHADPSRGNKNVEGGGRADVTDVDEGAGAKTPARNSDGRGSGQTSQQGKTMIDRDGDEHDREPEEARPQPGDEAGEDEGSSAKEGDERHLNENQKNKAG